MIVFIVLGVLFYIGVGLLLKFGGAEQTEKAAEIVAKIIIAYMFATIPIGVASRRKVLKARNISKPMP